MTMPELSVIDRILEMWLKEVENRLMPSEPMLRTHVFVREYAEGCLLGFWNTRTYVWQGGSEGIAARYSRMLIGEMDFESDVTALARYLQVRWDKDFVVPPSVDVLMTLGYVSNPKDSHGNALQPVFNIQAFQLINDIGSPIVKEKVFISYSRKVSSAFALLIMNRLKDSGFDAFIDMAIPPGDDWHADVEQRVKECDAFVLVLAPTTLDSPIVRKEIKWAMEAQKKIFPLYHGELKALSRSSSFGKQISKINAIIVSSESAGGYNAAIVDLLNRFGVTP